MKNEEGTTAIEYAVIASLVSVAIVAALSNLGSIVEAFYTLVGVLVAAAV